MKKTTYNARAVVEAGLISSLIVVIMLFTGYVPVFSVFGTLILPIPVTILYIRHGYKITLSSIVVSAVLTAILYDPISAVTAGVTYGLIGMTLGYSIKRDKKVSTTMILLTVASLLVSIVSILITLLFIEKTSLVVFINNSVNTLKSSLNESVNTTKALYMKLGVSSQQLSILDQYKNVLNTNVIMGIIPAGLLMQSFISAYFNYVVTKLVLKKLKYEMRDMIPFSQIYIPNLLGAFLVGLYALGIILNSKNVPGANYILTSTQVIFQSVFILNGAAIVVYYLRNRFRLSKANTALIIILTLFLGVSVLYFYLGMIDLIFDFRKLNPNRIRRI